MFYKKKKKYFTYNLKYHTTDSEAFSYKHVTYTKKRALFKKIDFLTFPKIRPK